MLRLLRPVLMRMTQRLAEDRLTVFAFDAAESMDDESMGALDALLRDGRDTRAAGLACLGGPTARHANRTGATVCQRSAQRIGQIGRDDRT